MPRSSDPPSGSQRTLPASAEVGNLDGPTVHNVTSTPQLRLEQYIGEVIDGRYVVERLLGEGGMGVVYGGRHKVIDKRVAIKILRGDLAADQEMTERFLNEARAASSIGNPHIVDISDFGRLPDGATYFVMEFLDGKSLSRLMADRRGITLPRMVHVAKQIAKGLSAAHAKGITHRDLKPDNVMLIHRGDDKDFVKVLDFGIAKVGSEAGRLTRAGSVFGTPHYMSPEQAAGVPVDQRTDIYSLGVILYEMAAGKVPFDADNFMGILTQHMYKAPVPIRAIVPEPQEVPPGLEAVVLKCLSKKVELRYQTMDELASDLEKVESGLVPDAVAEMMARSGGFNVPADYFRNPARTGPTGVALMPAMPVLPQRRSVFWWGLGGAVVTSLVVVTGVVAYSRSNAETTPAELGTIAVDPTSAPIPTQPTASAGAAATVAVPTVEVVIQPEPEDAVVYAGDKKVGIGERAIRANAGEHLTVRVEKQGYKPKTVDIDGSQARVRVKLEREASAKPAPNPRPPPKAASAPATTPQQTAAPPPTTCPAGLWKDPFGNCTKI